MKKANFLVASPHLPEAIIICFYTIQRPSLPTTLHWWL